MTVLSGAQVAQYARGAGLKDEEAVAVAVAVSRGESGWDTDAVGDVGLQDDKWGPSIGLWQIRSLKAESGTGRTRDATRLKDPAFNARSMYQVSGGGVNWKPWTIYNTGAYRQYLDGARQSTAEAPGALTSGGVGVVGGALPGPPVLYGTPPGALSQVLANGQLREVLFNDTRLKADVAELVTKLTVDLTTNGVSQLTIDVADQSMAMLKTNLLKKGTAVKVGDLQFDVSAFELVDTGAGPGLTITARSKGAQKLRRQRGPLVVNNVSPTDFMGRLCAEAGIRFVGQPSVVRASCSRVLKDDSKDDPAKGMKAIVGGYESSWEAGERLAEELGFWFFEASGVVFFAQPSWLMKRRVPTVWRWPDAKAPGEIGRLNVPSFRTSDDDYNNGASGTLLVPQIAAYDLRPGQPFNVVDLPAPVFDGLYLITDVNYELDGVTPATVSLATPVDPAPRPPEVEHDDSMPTGFDELTGGTNELVLRQVSDQGFQWPAFGTITGRFGDNRGDHRHSGLDIAASEGTRVVAAKDGEVVLSEYHGDYGNVIYIDHGRGVQTRYAHLSRIDVRKPTQVARGQVIGAVGTTGHSTGPHLHFEVRIPGERSPNVATNPLSYLPQLPRGPA